ncbi:MAG: DsbA family protein [Candidatus Aenigmatarchaeota archaeon]
MARKLSRRERRRLKYAEAVKENKSQPKIKTSKKILFALMLALLIIIYLFQINKPKYTPTKTDIPTAGNPNATVTIKSFSEFQCLYCSEFFIKTYPKIKSKYIESGKVKFMFYEFPLEELHPFSMKAAEAARCAHEQGKYEEYAFLLYSRQNQWTKAGPEKFKDYAKELGLNVKEFSNCLDSGVMREIIMREIEEGRKLQVMGTPTFFINDRRIVGAKPYEDFEKVIENLLSKNTT